MNRCLLSLLLAAMLLAPAVYAAEPAKPAIQPPQFRSGVVERDDFLSVSRDGRLIRHNLAKNTARDYGDFGEKLTRYVAVRGDRACVATKKAILLIDLRSGRQLRGVPHGNGLARVGFLDDARVYAANHRFIEVFDVASGRSLRRIEIKPIENDEDKSRLGLPALAWNKKEVVPCHRQGELLYLALPDAVGERRMPAPTLAYVAVVDLAKGAVKDVVRIGTGISDLFVVRGRYVDHEMLYVCTGHFSYSTLLQRYQAIPVRDGKIEVESKTARYARLPLLLESGRATPGRFFQSDGALLTTYGQDIHRFDSAGKLVAVAKKAFGPGHALVGVWNDKAVVSDAKTVHVVTLQKVKTAVKATTPGTR